MHVDIMKEENIYRMSEADEKISDILCKIGFTLPEGKILIYLTHFEEAKSRDIERSMEMSQPEVSISIKNMPDLISTDKVYKQSRGRPVYVYKLRKSLTEIAEEKVQNNVDFIEKNIKELNDILKE